MLIDGVPIDDYVLYNRISPEDDRNYPKIYRKLRWPIGSSALTRQCASAFILTKFGQKSFSLQPVKTWYENVRSINYQMDHDENGLVIFNDFSGNDLTSARLKVEKYIRSLPDDEEFTARSIMEKFDVPAMTVYRILDKYCEKVDGKKASYRRSNSLF